MTSAPVTNAPTRDTLAAPLPAPQREAVVLPAGLALRKAVRAVRRLDHLPSQQEVLAIAGRPYRSLATSHLFSAAFGRPEAPVVARIGSA
jgi:3-methyladenine DNA glycosylase/8-oxoguanine DNA glycosylase